MSKEKKQRWYPGDLTAFPYCRYRIYLYMYDSQSFPDSMLTHVYHLGTMQYTTANYG